MSVQSTGDATVTAPVGAGEVATALQLTNVRRIEFDINRNMLFVEEQNGKRVEFAYDTVATVTYVIAGNNATVTVST